MSATFVWVNTIRQEWWNHSRGHARADIVAAARQAAADGGVLLTGELHIQVDTDDALPDGLLKVFVSCPAVRQRGAAMPPPRPVESKPRKRAAVAEHGTRARYVKGCRCVSCTAAERTYSREYKRRRRREGQLRLVEDREVS